MSKKITKTKYSSLIKNISGLLEESRRKVYYQVNNILVQTYWRIGKYVVEFEQGGKKETEYGDKLIDRISKDLKNKYGKGFSRSNLIYMRLFYKKFQTGQTVSDQLTWSHYIEILMIEEELERGFYVKQCEKENWSVRELKRQINSGLFYRLASSNNKKGILKLAKQGQVIKEAQDIIKDPYILEFLSIPENYKSSEKEIEKKIINNLQLFLLELGKGFAFIGRQFRITLNNKHFYVDLVFYHRILKCFVLIDLKIGKVVHGDVGQMNMYLNYFREEENSIDDNEPIGIVLGTKKDDVTAKYALGGITNKLFISKYKLYLPDKKILEKEIKKLL